MFDVIETAKVNELHLKSDLDTGLRAIIAIHNTNLGPALGGCRFVSYDDTNSAIIDAIRLAKGMSYKAAIAGLEQGGGKSVIMKPKSTKNPNNRQTLFESFGRFIEELNGRYITAMDSGTTLDDMEAITNQTKFVSSTKVIGDPSPSTAIGVFNGIQACVKHQLQQESLENVHVAIQGLGHVGYALASHLHQAGALLSVADIDPIKVKNCVNEFKATAIPIDQIHTVPCDIFSPCALGAIINNKTLPNLQCKIIAGAANNQLAEDNHGVELYQKGILYAPDYVINAGGLILASLKYQQKTDQAVAEKITNIAHTLELVFERSNQEGLATNLISNQMAEEILYP